MTQSAAKTNRDTSPREGPPRFSLFTLMIAVTVCAGVFGLTRIVGNIVIVWILAALSAGGVVGLAFGLVRRRIWRSVLGACVGSTLTSGFPLMFIVLVVLGTARQPLWLAADAAGIWTAVVIAVVGALGGVVGGAVGALSNERRAPEEVGVWWGAGTGALAILVPYAIYLGSGVVKGGAEFVNGLMIALCLAVIAANVAGVIGIIIGGITRLILGEQDDSPTRRNHRTDLPKKLGDN